MNFRLAPTFVLRAAVLWLLLRAVLFAGGRGAGATFGEPLTLEELLAFPPPTMLLAAGVTAVLVLIDVAAMHEQAFQANLGYDRRSIAATSFFSALGLEILTAILVPIVLA